MGTGILLSIEEIFEHRKIDRISSADLINALCNDEEQPWATYNYGRPITPRQLASLLREYGIRSKSIRTAYGTPKGFEKVQFIDVFSRYLNSKNICNTQQPSNNQACSVADN